MSLLRFQNSLIKEQERYIGQEKCRKSTHAIYWIQRGKGTETTVDLLVRIKRLVIAGQVIFTEKAEDEMSVDSLTPELVYEAILNAPVITKTLRSRNPFSGQREMLYVIKGLTFDSLAIYTKGKILKHESQEIFYVLISSKRSTD